MSNPGINSKISKDINSFDIYVNENLVEHCDCLNGETITFVEKYN